MKTSELPLAAQSAIHCALADLVGAWQAWVADGSGDSLHDWDAHCESIRELAEAFDLTNEIPEELKP